MEGKVRSINEMKKFAFIKTDSQSDDKDYFFHYSDFEGHWDDLVTDFNAKSGRPIRVEFEPVESQKGPRAKSVRRINFPNEG